MFPVLNKFRRSGLLTNKNETCIILYKTANFGRRVRILENNCEARLLSIPQKYKYQSENLQKSLKLWENISAKYISACDKLESKESKDQIRK